MGVYIKDLKKPEDCDVCSIRLVFITCGCDRDHCMFQEVPEPHGRLIDADALCDRLVSNHPVVIYAKNAPTIIPAEEGET